MDSPFELLSATLTPLTEQIEIHNVLVKEVHQADGGSSVLTVECDEISADIVCGRWKDFRAAVGKYGYLMPAINDSEVQAYFRAYFDQSLRRVPALDGPDPRAISQGRSPCVIGWRCDRKPQGFRAPAGIVPGTFGEVTPDETVSVSLRVPPEFVRLCRSYSTTPEEMLRGFAADASGIFNPFCKPRADGLTSHGSDERDMAEEYIRRAYEFGRVDIDALERSELEVQESEDAHGEFGWLVDNYFAAGGTQEELTEALERMIERRGAWHDE